MFRIPFKLFFILTLLTVTVAGANALTVGGPHATMASSVLIATRRCATGRSNQRGMPILPRSYEQLAAKTKPKHIANRQTKRPMPIHTNPIWGRSTVPIATAPTSRQNWSADSATPLILYLNSWFADSFHVPGHGRSGTYTQHRRKI